MINLPVGCRHFAVAVGGHRSSNNGVDSEEGCHGLFVNLELEIGARASLVSADATAEAFGVETFESVA